MNLNDYDLVLINSSAGKDSQAMLTHLVELADAQGVDRARLVVVHADLGRVEWKGTLELAMEQAGAYRLRFERVSRAGDLLDQVLTRRLNLDAAALQSLAQADECDREANALLATVAGGTATAEDGRRALDLIEKAAELREDAEKRTTTPAWPSSTARYCTSDQKTSQVEKLMTCEVSAWRERTRETRPMRILNCLGIRADESPARKKKKPVRRDPASNGKRDVTQWLPIFDWSEVDVWQTIARSGLRYHPAYAAGMPRLSCCFCVLAGRRELVRAARLNPDLAREYLAVEEQVGHTFKADLSMAEIVREAEALSPMPALEECH